MPEITITRDIDAPQADVWALVANPSRFADWNTLHTRWVTPPPDALAVGMVITEVVTIKGVVDTITFTTEELTPPRQVGLSGSGSTGSTVSLVFTVEELPDGRSTVSLYIKFESPLLFGPLNKVIERAFRKQLEASLQRLSSAFE
ncbi:SRPBCC family protein [Actinokineospora sp. PR83]|uniref:type II toxin-antitoxin system Rv0910 family toxin n=1 Tax=Actinokineospora sp. PR83 TaxID=2884908 RepID=UPI001F3A8409|nr:SRPBCC family protein [Actinokineospora sp. PR83]MCG8919743.1 SRPBCC family protein [Actinokineospora sp. PR83]